MKTRNLVTGAAAAAMMIWTAGCMSDNSVGGGTGGTGAPGTGGATTPAGTGGAPSTGTGGAVAVGTGGAGTGGVGPSGSGGGVGAGGAGGRAQPGTGGATVGSMGGAGPIAAGGDSKCGSTAAAIGKLCDGFEGAAPGAATSPWTFSLMGATGVVDATKPYRGTKSVHMMTMTGGAFITETATFTQTGTAATNNNSWGRMFIWFATAANPQSHDVFITLEDPASAAASAQFHVAGGSRGHLASQIRTTADLYHPAMGTGAILFPLTPPKWQCWEWHTTAANTLEFYVDGALYAPMSVVASDNWPFPIFKKLSLGFMQFTATPATELWIDEVAVDTARIGCDN